MFFTNILLFSTNYDIIFLNSIMSINYKKGNQMNYLLFNPLSKNGTDRKIKDEAKLKLNKQFPQLEEINVIDLKIENFIKNLHDEDILILVGGDGTLNHFGGRM